MVSFRFKKEQKKKREKKRLRWVSLVFLLIMVIFLGEGVFKLVGSLKNSLWDGKSRLTVAVESNPVLIFSFEPGEESLNCFLIPGETLVKTIEGYGDYRADSVWKLGELEGKEKTFFSESFEIFLGTPIDGWLKPASFKSQFGGHNQDEEAIKALVLNLLVGSIKKENQTNLSNWDLARLFLKLKGVRLNNLSLIDLSKTGAFEKENLPDGTEVFKAEASLIDRLVKKLFSDSLLRKEAIPILVYNGTKSGGLANEAARLISNSGGRVVRVGDGEKEVEDCEIYGQGKVKESYTFKKLKNIFDCQEIEKTGESGADITLLLGKGYQRKLKGD